MKPHYWKIATFVFAALFAVSILRDGSSDPQFVTIESGSGVVALNCADVVSVSCIPQQNVVSVLIARTNISGPALYQPEDGQSAEELMKELISKIKNGGGKVKAKEYVRLQSQSE